MLFVHCFRMYEALVKPAVLGNIPSSVFISVFSDDFVHYYFSELSQYLTVSLFVRPCALSYSVHFC